MTKATYDYSRVPGFRKAAPKSASAEAIYPHLESGELAWGLTADDARGAASPLGGLAQSAQKGK